MHDLQDDGAAETSTRALEPGLELRVELDRRVNFAMQQNDVPVVKSLHVENLTDAALADLEVKITVEPAFAETWSRSLAEVGGRSTFNIDAVDLALSPGYLAALTERVRGRLAVEVLCGGETLARRVEELELLARDEWSGLASLPEILAAFVVPNHPAVASVLVGAAGLLETWTGDPSFDGYERKDPGRVLTVAAAVYGALQALELTYITPPASFEERGQRVRPFEQILESRMATCLDVALLAAACLEQAGLNALLVLVEGHAFTGVWLTGDTFPEPATFDHLRLRKRVDLDEIAVFDATGVTTRPPLVWEQASADARRRLDDPERFLCVIDVRRARKGRVRPLPQTVERVLPGAVAEPDSAAPIPTVAAPDVSGLAPIARDLADESAPAETPESRLDRWRRKLLDLSLRNRLLNFRDTKKTLPLLCPDAARLEDMLAAGTVFTLHERPTDLGAADPRDPEAHRRRTGEDALSALLAEELEARRLRVDATPEELERRLIEIYRAARLGLEEGGASALYLAIGFLTWYETGASEQPRRAPILLLPVQLDRKSARKGFSLRLGDDEPRINVTLLEMLRQDHGLDVPELDPLPEDESGPDVARILKTVRQGVRDVDRWDVSEDACLGLFSFTKFLMWRDLSERADDLLKSPVVEHLVNRPDQPFDPGAVMPAADRLDDERSTTETYCPLPADSSQLAAVFAAADGKSFVLEGPPGTGKSQTITNLIAHCLAEGKSVLFVSEKMAALNVVSRRLGLAGLGRYCLELHSNKTRKRDVLGQLEESLQRFDAPGSEDWEREALRLAALRSELNAYVRALHERRVNGETVFQVTSRLVGLRDVPRAELRWESPDTVDANALALLGDLVERVATAGAACGDVALHAFAHARCEYWTPTWAEKVGASLEALEARARELGDAARDAAARLALAEADWSRVELHRMKEAAELLSASPGPPIALLVNPEWDDIRSQIRRWVASGRKRDGLRAELRAVYTDAIVGLDEGALTARLARAKASWWPASWWHRRAVRNALAGVARNGRLDAGEDLGRALQRMRALREEEQRLEDAGARAHALLGRFWNDGEGDWDRIEAALEWTGRLRKLALDCGGEDFERVGALRETWARLATEGRELLAANGAVGRVFTAYREALERFVASARELVALLDLDTDAEWPGETSKDELGRVRASLAAWRGALDGLRTWCAWRKARAEAERANLANVVAVLEQGGVTSEGLRSVFERSYGEWWLSAVIDREAALQHFFSPEHERKIQQFGEVDARYMQLTRHLIQARLAEREPGSLASTASTASTRLALPSSEVGILKHEIGKKRRHLSVRKLFQKIPNLLPRMKPCLLMSPISVAQYLDADHPPFDLVVFDEASQIPVWDAVGALARGRQAIVVGDPKQLPPTSFFQRAEGDEDDDVEDELFEDLESILDDCIGAQIPWLPLNWHYRSRHESLITFSNYHYYANRLLTFPSPFREGMGVSWRHVPDGVYDKGKSRTNRGEADAVVREILVRLRDPARRDFTIGVVTFNQAQQSLIEDLLDAARAEDPELDRFFSEEAEEPVFVKNLENVQGDERDLILFSICYGPDRSGKVSMNFGPMNREGGERRLNVAITRARREVCVFSTLTADQIDLARTRARGVGDLKGFLEYAARGPAAIAEAVQLDPEADFDSPFEEAVFDALVARGWQVHKQVGCASYRIDLAVVDPDAPGRYLLGVECDGANYHRAKTARDRDKLRQAVLRDLGWELHRIWSTDFWTNPRLELEKLEAALGRARDRVVAPPGGDAGDAGDAGEDGSEDEEATRFASSPAPAAQGAVSERPPGPATVLATYRPLAPRAAGTMDAFFATDDDSRARVRATIAEVVVAEGPISLDLAARRVASAWGFERVRSTVVERVRELIAPAEAMLQRTQAGDFLWAPGVDPAAYAGFRIATDDEGSSRKAEDLPLEEIANAAHEILRSHISAPTDELVRETARLFGIRRVGANVRERMLAGIGMLEPTGRARRDGEALVLVSNSRA